MHREASSSCNQINNTKGYQVKLDKSQSHMCDLNSSEKSHISPDIKFTLNFS